MDISKRKIFKDTLIYTILPKIYVFANLLVTPIISPYLSLNDFGIYGLIMAYLNVFQIVINLGQNVVMQNAFFEYRKNYILIWRRSFGLMILAGVLFAGVFSGIIFLTLAPKLGGNAWLVCALCSFYLIFSPIETIAVNYYVLHERSFPYAICSTIVGSVSVLINLVAIRYFHLGYLGWIIVMPVSTVVMYLYYSRRFFVKEKIFPVFRLSASFLKKDLKVGAPLIPHQLSLYILGTSDRLLLEYFGVSTAQIGFYSQGYNLASYGNVFVSGIFQAVARKLQEGFRGEEERHRRFIRKSMLTICALTGGVLFLAALWMKEIFRFLYRKPELQQAYPVAILVTCSYMFWTIYTFFVYPLSIRNKTLSISRISVLAAVFNVVLNILLIPRYGIWAALGATYVSYMFFGFGGVFSRENRLFMSKYVNILRFTVGMTLYNILLTIVAYFCRDYSFPVKGLMTVLTLAGAGAGYLYIIRKKS